MANTKVNKSALGYLGTRVQKQIVKLMAENPKWLSVYINDIKKDSKFFTEPYLDPIVKIIRDKFQATGCCPSYREIYAAMKAIYSTEEEYMAIKELITELSRDELLKDIDTAENTGIAALKKAEVLYTIDNVRSKIENSNDIDTACRDTIEKLIKISTPVESKIRGGKTRDFKELIFNCGEDALVPTGIPELDKQLNGGIPKGKVALLIAGTGVGKTTLSSIISIGAALQQYKVMHICFEDSPEEVMRMYVARLTEHYLNEIKGENGDKIYEEVYSNENYAETLDNYIRTYQYPNGDTTVEMIEQNIKNMINEGYKPDMVFIDYLSCLLPTENKMLAIQNEWQVWEKCMKKLEVLAKELDIVVWVSQQTNRDGAKLTTAINRMANIQGSFRAVQPAAFVLYLDKTDIPEGETNRANLFLDKCRGCQKKEWRGCYLNNGTCQIDLSDVVHLDENLDFEN